MESIERGETVFNLARFAHEEHASPENLSIVWVHGIYCEVDG